MESTAHRAIAIVGAGAILPDAPNVATFWDNVKNGRYSISEVSSDRWDPSAYYDPDPAAPDKTYSKIGGWIRQCEWDPMKWRLAIPPRVAEAMDGTQKWAIACTRQALNDYGYPSRELPSDRVAVILGNAMGGEKHYFTVMRAYFPEYARELSEASSFAALPEAVRTEITRELHERFAQHLPEITEDTMPGELANCVAGRIANLFNFRGPNYVVDAACASAMAAIHAAVEGLIANEFDVAVTGGIDRNMGASTFIKFCKIGALSASGSRPYAEGADGFVMGEGAAVFVLKRLADAERDGDKIYAVLRGIGGASDGKGKGITAPNPVGQRLAVERGWQNAGLSPQPGTLIEGHGTSTRVGDVVEVQSLLEVLGNFHLPPASVALGSIKSNIGHLKGAAGAAGLLKTALALRDKVLPPSIRCERTNPDIDFAHSPVYVNTDLKPWDVPPDQPRRAGLSAFGFGGTNFHAVLEEYIPGRINGNSKRSVAVGDIHPAATGSTGISGATPSPSAHAQAAGKLPLRGALVIGAASETALSDRLRSISKEAEAGRAPAPAIPAEPDLRAPERLSIDYADAAELADKSVKALKALESAQPAMWKALRAQGIFRGQGPAGRVAFLYTGQGSQYVNMLKSLRDTEPIVAETFAEADRVMTPLLGKPLSQFIFIDQTDPAAVSRAEEDLRQTAITQPAVLAADIALTRLLAAYGIEPDMTMGHSLGEYGALVAAGALPFEDALQAVSARGREMTRVSLADNGRMAAVFAPLREIERILKTVDGYVVIANINSDRQAVIGGASKAVEQGMELLKNAGFSVVPLSVSHAFHTSIVAPASGPLREVLSRLRLQSPRIPVVANVNGEFYPTGPDVVPRMLDILAAQVASPVQFSSGLHTLYEAGVRTFVETGPKRALQGFVDDVLADCPDVLSLFTNHPKTGDTVAFNQALCGLYAAGLGHGAVEVASASARPLPGRVPQQSVAFASNTNPPPADFLPPANGDHFVELGRLFAEVLERGWHIYHPRGDRPAQAPVAITGAALGLPGAERVFDDANVARILGGEQFIDAIPTRLRRAMLDKNITRLVKSESGGPSFETIHELSEVIKLAGRGGAFDLEKEFGVSAERIAALDRTTRLAIGAGLDALRDAGIPLVLRYKTTSKGTLLPDRWGLPDALRDDTGVIFASAFPGCDSFADEMSRYYTDRARREQIAALGSLRARTSDADGAAAMLRQEIDRRIADLRAAVEKEPYVFDRRFLFRVLAMGHSQFAEFIGARGPNTQINAACASTAQAVSLAEDWISAGRCCRVIIVSADDVTSDHLMEWMGAGFLATGAAATDEVVEDAAVPFDRRRHGMLIGMGAAAMVVESADAARERGIRPICELLSAVTANSAFHGTRLDVQHIAEVMETLIAQAEARCGIARRQIAPQTVFVSHETYTPARGGSASAEIHALRSVFGEAADRIVIANTKGFTGHAMATGIEDVVAVKALETGVVPPVINFREVDPELGTLNLSKGGIYPVEYALRLGAGFGSQISMTLVRWCRTNAARPSPNALGYASRIADPAAWKQWLSGISGCPAAELEIVNRTLRVRDQRAAARMQENVQRADNAQIARAPSRPAAAPLLEPKPAPAAIAEPKAAPVPLVETRPAPAAEAAAAPQPQVPLATPQPPAPPQAAAQDDVRARVLALVSEKTGYPVDMLDVDLDLEADLGVDTVKQAEVFAAIRAAYNISRDEALKLRDFPTLAHVIRFVYDKRPELAQSAAISVAAPKEKPSAAMPVAAPPAPAVIPVEVNAPASAPPANDAIRQSILALVVEKTGYPPDMLDLDLDLEADLGVDTVKQAELFAAIRGLYNIPREENLKLRDFPTLAHVIRFVYDKRPDLAGTAAPTPQPVAATAAITEPSAATSTAPSASTEAIQNTEAIKDKVLEIVAEKTGYPKDMLDLDLDLEADLGIDTVKQAEMFAAIRAAYNIPRDENLKLRDFPTLAHVIKFACDRQAKAGAPAAPPESIPKKPAASVSVAAAATQRARPPVASFDAANRIPRRVPVPVLRPPLALCKKTGVSLGRGSRVVIMPDKAGIADALAQQLQALQVEVLRIEGTPDATALTDLLKKWTASTPVQGIYWLPALDYEGPISEMSLTQWHEAIVVRLKLLYTAMRSLYEQIAVPNSFLVSATLLGGRHGYDDAGAIAPLGGVVTGFTKTFKRERPDALVKSVDFGPDRHPSDIAAALIAETLSDPGAVEIGYKSGLRWAVGLQEQAADDGHPGLTLDGNTVFLVTGAAGSIVSAITADLAAASGGTFYLLDVVPEPNPNNADLKRFTADKDGLKRDLFTRIQQRGERATPALVEKELAALERAQAAQTAIDAVRAAGGAAHYFSVNLTDPDAVDRVIQQVRARSGRIDVLLHAAGLERSHFLPDKDPREFDLVFDVKSDGWFNLLHAIGDMPLGATVAFSSVAGRFGNAGQADYSAANDLLCKIASSFRTTRPATRAIAIDWTAWGGIGMATRGSIPKMMELAGIDMLPPQSGIPLIRRELTTGSTRGEVVIAQRLGVMLNEWDTTGGLDPAALETAPHGPMIGKVTGAGLYSSLRVDTTLDPKLQPFLRDHQIDGTPVLPGVMGIEAFAEAASCLLPGWHIDSIEDVNFLAPFKFYRHEPRTVSVNATFRPEGDTILAECRLTGSRQLPNQPEPQVITHFTARVRLVKGAPKLATAAALGVLSGAITEQSEIYRLFFHGPAYQVVKRAWRDDQRIIGQLSADLPANHVPAEQPALASPRIIELCFQTAGLWEIAVHGRFGLPQHLDRVCVSGTPDTIKELFAVVTPAGDGSFTAEVLDRSGNRYVQMSGYHTVALAGAAAEPPKTMQAVA